MTRHLDRTLVELMEDLRQVDERYSTAYKEHLQVNEDVLSFVLIGEYYDVFSQLDNIQSLRSLEVIEKHYSSGCKEFRDVVDVSFLEQYVIDRRNVGDLPSCLQESAQQM